MLYLVSRRRRGVTAVLAMLYLVLMATLAAGFYAVTNNAVQVTQSHRRVHDAAFAAESGMEFIRYHLAQLSIPYGTPSEKLFGKVKTHLSSAINGTANVNGGSIGLGDTTISIPAGANDWVSADPRGAQFRITIQDMTQSVRVKVVGRGSDSSILRAIQIDYNLAQRASRIFDYGVASKGKIWTDGSSKIKGATDPTKGSVLSTCTTDPIPVVIRGKEVSGDISVSNPNATVIVDGASIGGETSMAVIMSDHVHKGVEPPEFPTVDTAAFQAFATNTYSAAGGNNQTLVNCRIPANTNPSFTGTTKIQGVLYIETPNKVDFGGNVSIQGVIVTQNNPTGTISTNTISFKGGVDSTGVETLPASFGKLREMTGSFLLAPGFATLFTGDFKTINGSILVSRLSMSGNAGGTILGTVVNLDDTLLSLAGSSEIVIASTGTSNYPTGVFFSSRYVPLADTYEEVKP